MDEEQYDFMEVVTAKVVRWATASHVLILIVILLLAWVLLGPPFGFSPDWQSLMTVPTTIVTFVLVFLILRAQNKDTKAIQLKLNEIIASMHGANNALIDVENQSEKTIEDLHQKYETVAQHVKEEPKGTTTDAIMVDEVVEQIEAEESGKTAPSRVA